LLLAVGAPCAAGEDAPAERTARVGAVRRYDVVHRRGGEAVTGIIILQGPRGVVVAVTQGDSLEVFVPTADIERIEPRTAAPEDQQAQGDTVTRYVAESRDGALTLAGITGGEPPRKRPAAAKAPWLDKDDDDDEQEEGDSPAARGPVLPRGLPTLGRTDKVLRDEDEEEDDEPATDGDLDLFGQDQPDLDDEDDD
jgi:hypothetical protein